MLRQVLVLLAVTSVAQPAAVRQPLEEKPEEYKDCDGCWVSAIQQFIPTGESVPSPSQCGEYRCTATDVQIYSCSPVGVKPSCYVTRNESLPYPNCCPQIICPKN